MDLEVLPRVIVDRAHEHLLAPHLAAQVTRQRHAVVERMALGGDDHDQGIWIRLTQVLGAGLPSDAVAEDYVAPAH